ncbi:uncharacterized protein METZ01_LOCUS210424, partial [marine metagenome]
MDETVSSWTNGTGVDSATASRSWPSRQCRFWWQATDQAMQLLKQHHGKVMADVKVIGLSGQMHGATVLDKHARPLRPAIL